MDDVVLNGAALLVFTGLLGSVTAALSFMFHAYQGAVGAQLADLEEDRNYWRALALRSLQVQDKGTAVLERLVDRGA